MKNKKKLGAQHSILIFFVACFFVFSFSQHAYASEPELIVTWRADNFYPTTYQGKAIPTYGTKIYFAVEAIQDGKLLDLSKSLIEWRKNGERVRKGEGEQEAIVVFSETDATFFVSVTATIGEKQKTKSVTIPITNPKLIIEIPYPNKIVPKSTDIVLRAIPYFFNAKSLSDFNFSWQIGALKKGTGSDNTIIINTGSPNVVSERTVNVNGYAQNKRSLLEIVKTPTKFYISE